MIPKEILERTAAHAKPLGHLVQRKKLVQHGLYTQYRRQYARTNPGL